MKKDLAKEIIRMINKEKEVHYDKIKSKFKLSKSKTDDVLISLLGKAEFWESKPKIFRSWE